MDGEPDAEVRVEAWTREASPPPGDPRRSTFSRLATLESTGQIDDLSVGIWSDYVSTASGNGSPACERIEAFREWADRTGNSLAPAFQRVQRSTVVATESVATVRPPLLCLAVYADGGLVAVFPCTDDGETRTVEDCLERLEAGRVPDLTDPDR